MSEKGVDTMFYKCMLGYSWKSNKMSEIWLTSEKSSDP